MSKNKEIIVLINTIRIMQKDVLHEKKNQEELDKLMKELNNHPLYIEYSNIVFEINNTFAIMENSINNYFDKLLN